MPKRLIIVAKFSGLPAKGGDDDNDSFGRKGSVHKAIDIMASWRNLMKRLILFSAILAASVVVACGLFVGLSTSGFAQNESVAFPLPTRAAAPNYPSLAPVLKTVLPGVVNIAASGHVAIQTNPLFNDPFFRQFFAPFNIPLDAPAQRIAKTQSVGSGVIVDAQNGYVVTNNHVVKNADEIYVILLDKRKIKAKIIGTDPETDIALLQIKEENLTALPLGNSDSLQVGDYVVAIGNPFGLGNTATYGIVSALGRTGLGIDGYENFIQTDASINPGNSGGALINFGGELIGINAAILSKTAGNIGIGFAIPINMVRSVMNELIAHGKVSHGQIGAEFQDVTPDIESALGVDFDGGAIITKVLKNGPAAQAGLERGDVVLWIDGNAVTGAGSLRIAIGLKRIGDKAELELIRKGARKTVSVTVSKPETRDISDASEAKEIDALQGAKFSDIPEDHPRYGKMRGVYIADVAPDSPAAYTGLRKGDIIVSINQKTVATPQELEEAAKLGKRSIQLRIKRGNMDLYISFR